MLYTELIVTSFFYFKTVPNSFFINIKAFFIIPLFGWLFIKPLITKYYTLQSENKKLFKFKRNYSLFKQSLLAERKIDYKNLESVITIGNKNAKLKISIVTNPLCNFCKKTHFAIEELLYKYSENIQINIHFSFLLSKENNNQKDLLHYKLIDIYLTQGKVAFMKALGIGLKTKTLKNGFLLMVKV